MGSTVSLPIGWGHFPTRQAAARPSRTTGVPVARVVVDVMLKPEILDPQGRAVQGALGRLGLSGVQDVRQGKQFVIELEGDLEGDRAELMEKLAGELLSNPVIEDFRMTVEQ
jgi:phosphoribosylformylglycinamidine synthase PurS subunit